MLGRLALLFTENYFNAIYRIVNCNYYYSDINTYVGKLSKSLMWLLNSTVFEIIPKSLILNIFSIIEGKDLQSWKNNAISM